MRIGCFIVAVVVLSAVSAEGASFDCRRAASDSEHAVCADAKLSAMDDELARRYAAALARSLDPAGLRSEQGEWLARIRKLTAPQDIATAYAVRLEALGRLVSTPELAAEKRLVRESEVRTSCLAAFAGPVAGAPCKVVAFGDIGAVDGNAFAYALYAFRTPEGGTLDGQALIFARLGEDRLRVLFAPGNEGGPFYEPKIIHSPAGVLLLVPGYDTGTGNFNRERLFVWRDRAWHAVDATSWLATLQRRLPKGLGAWKGIYPDYKTMRAATPLWRDGDSNASPTGGRAAIRLALRGDRIVLESLGVSRR